MTSPEEAKIDIAAGGFSEEEMKLVHLLRTLDIKPRIGSVDDIAKLAKALSGTKEEPKHFEDPDPGKAKSTSHHFPKLSIFYGEEGKGEVTWDTFKYEVDALIAEGTYTNEQIMFGIRRAVKGSAGDRIRRLGPGVTPLFVLQKLDSDYGSVENKETALKKFYTCEQKPNESIESFATRLEELFYKAVELKAFRITDTDILKQVLHEGLKKDMKQMSVYQRDKIPGYDDFKKELRKMEAEMKTETDDKKPCKPVVNTDKKEDSEIVQLLKQLNGRIDKLEKEQNQNREEDVEHQQHHWYRGIGRGRWRGDTRGRGTFQGRGTYRPQRPYGSGTFSPTCFVCNRKGHVQFNCPTITAQLVCLHCKEKGHVKKDCPKL